jgi:hypothetical protein
MGLGEKVEMFQLECSNGMAMKIVTYSYDAGVVDTGLCYLLQQIAAAWLPCG